MKTSSKRIRIEFETNKKNDETPKQTAAADRPPPPAAWAAVARGLGRRGRPWATTWSPPVSFLHFDRRFDCFDLQFDYFEFQFDSKAQLISFSSIFEYF